MYAIRSYYGSDGSYAKVKTDSESHIDNQAMIESYIGKLEKAVKKENGSQIQQLTNRLFKDS